MTTHEPEALSEGLAGWQGRSFAELIRALQLTIDDMPELGLFEVAAGDDGVLVRVDGVLRPLQAAGIPARPQQSAPSHGRSRPPHASGGAADTASSSSPASSPVGPPPTAEPAPDERQQPRGTPGVRVIEVDEPMHPPASAPASAPVSGPASVPSSGPPQPFARDANEAPPPPRLGMMMRSRHAGADSGEGPRRPAAAAGVRDAAVASAGARSPASSVSSPASGASGSGAGRQGRAPAAGPPAGAETRPTPSPARSQAPAPSPASADEDIASTRFSLLELD